MTRALLVAGLLALVVACAALRAKPRPPLCDWDHPEWWDNRCWLYADALLR